MVVLTNKKDYMSIIMKRTIILAITFVCLFAHNAFSQQPYRTFKQSGEDIEKYLKYNFEERVEGNYKLYEGKTFAQLMSDLEIKPLGFSYTGLAGTTYSDGRYVIVSIDLYFTCRDGKKFSSRTDEYISIFWETPILNSNIASRTKAKLSPPAKGQKKYEALSDLIAVYPTSKWVSQHYDFFKDHKIEIIRYSLQKPR